MRPSALSAATNPSGLWLALRRLCSAGRQRANPPLVGTAALPPLPPRRPATAGPAAATGAAQQRTDAMGGRAAAAGAAAAADLAGSPSKPVAAAGGSVGPAKVIAAAKQAAAKAEARAERLRLQMQEAEDAGVWRQRGEALRARRENSEVSSAALREEELPDPSKDLAENEELCFKRAEKQEKTRARCAPLIDEAAAEAAAWREAVAALPEAEADEMVANLEALNSLHLRLREAGILKEPKKPVVADPAAVLRRKYGKEIDCFHSPSGHEVVVGRSAGANERVSFELAWKDGFWFHADSGVAGSHVAILCRAEEVSYLEDVEFAAAITAWHSKARNEPLAAVCYCYGGQVSRPRVPKLGLVRILGPRGQLHVAPSHPPC